jgi:hypothetical protein
MSEGPKGQLVPALAGRIGPAEVEAERVIHAAGTITRPFISTDDLLRNGIWACISDMQCEILRLYKGDAFPAPHSAGHLLGCLDPF